VAHGCAVWIRVSEYRFFLYGMRERPRSRDKKKQRTAQAQRLLTPSSVRRNLNR
jgi:hypothetical protein